MVLDHRVMIGAVDFVTMLAVVLLCTGVGLYHSRKKKGDREKNLEDYTLGNRKMPIIPAALSILATKLSGISMAGGVGEEYSYGPQMSLLFVGYFFGQIITATVFVPVLRRDKYTSIYQYLEKRFDRSIRMVFSILYIFSHIIYVGIILYVPAISVTAVSGIPFEITILVTGLTCTLYCVMGGFKAVVWTDAVQTVVMFLCFILVIVQGTIFVGSPAKVWRKSVESGFIQHWTFHESSYYRYSVWSVFATGVYTSLRDMGVGQAGVQRLLSIKTTKGAQLSTMVSATLGLLFMLLLLMSSTIIYVYYHECDPLIRKNVTFVENEDQIFVYSIVEFMHHIPGLSGIAISGVLSGAISSFSSYINAFATITLEDHISVIYPALLTTERRKLVICKILTGIYGVFSVFFAFLVPYMGGVIKSTFSTVSILTGPLCGVLLLGFFHRRYNRKSCMISLAVSVSVCLALEIASQLQDVTSPKLPVSIDRCNETDYNVTFATHHYAKPIVNATEEGAKNAIVVSFMWYGPIGIVLCIITGYATSFLFPEEYVNPKLLHPLIAPHSDYESVNTVSMGQINGESKKLEVEEKVAT